MIFNQPKKDRRTLLEFSTALNEHAGRQLRFAATVMELRDIRVIKGAVGKVRDKINEELRHHLEMGEFIGTAPSGRMVLSLGKPTPVVTKKIVTSAVVKKADPVVWANCNAKTPYAAVTAPKWMAEPDIDLPKVTHSCALDTLLRMRDELPRESGLRSEEEDHLYTLRKIAAEFGWDGLPLEFSDGWRVQLFRNQFSAKKLEECYPEVFAKLAVETTTGGTQNLIVRPFTDEIGDEIGFEGE